MQGVSLKKAFENVVCDIAEILSRPPSVMRKKYHTKKYQLITQREIFEIRL